MRWPFLSLLDPFRPQRVELRRLQRRLYARRLEMLRRLKPPEVRR
jgi:hypothetical protein